MISKNITRPYTPTVKSVAAFACAKSSPLLSAGEGKRYMQMKIILGIGISLFTSLGQAAECDLALQNLVKKLDNKGSLYAEKNVYLNKFIASEFDETCSVIHKAKEYILYLHPDDVSIVISFKDEKTGFKRFHGPFNSAYKK